MKTLLRIGGIVLTSSLLANSAQAATPKLSNTLIVPNKSVGALKLGQSPSAAKAAWGKGTCVVSGLCTFGTRANGGGFAAYSLASNVAGAAKTVLTITLEAGPFSASTKRNYKTPLTRFKTAKGIGLGSTKAQLLRAYPHMTSDEPNFYVIPHSEFVETIFGVLGGRVDLIVVGEHG
jgi:hypothetical protein